MLTSVRSLFSVFPARETDHLQEERRHVDKQTEDLAFNNYKTFIQTANCSSDILKDVGSFVCVVIMLIQSCPPSDFMYPVASSGLGVKSPLHLFGQPFASHGKMPHNYKGLVP